MLAKQLRRNFRRFVSGGEGPLDKGGIDEVRFTSIMERHGRDAIVALTTGHNAGVRTGSQKKALSIPCG